MKISTSCNDNASFTPDEMRFTKPFANSSTVVFKSSAGQTDTVTFHPIIVDTVKYRNLEQGFYNENFLGIDYELTNNSFHKILGGSTERFLLFLKAKNSHSANEISFLGLLFNEDYLNKVMDTKDSLVVFSQENARYTGVNINEGIKRFTFDFNKGVVSFVDRQDREWIRTK